MKEFSAILNEYEKIDFSARHAALATVVKVHGSSYRSPGARMLIMEDGRWVGSISGGCLEGDALRKARQVMSSKKAMTVTYDTREESNQNLGIGLGCNGVIDVLIEPIVHDSLSNAITVFKSFIGSLTPVALATIYNGKCIGEKLLIDDAGKILLPFNTDPLNGVVYKDLISIFETRKSESKTYRFQNEVLEIFLEVIQPTIILIIFGGGFDARPVSKLAKSLGWNVNVTDECVAHIAPLFFPDADKLSLCERKFIERDFNITPYTACVLMSHNYEYDRDVLKKLLTTSTPYIGILGPRKRFEKMKEEFLKEGITLNSNQLHKIHSPIGLDIGAEAPDEIAVSIIGEIQSKFSNRGGGFLKYRSGPIHQRDPEKDLVFKQVYLNPDNNKSASNA